MHFASIGPLGHSVEATLWFCQSSNSGKTLQIHTERKVKSWRPSRSGTMLCRPSFSFWQWKKRENLLASLVPSRSRTLRLFIYLFTFLFCALCLSGGDDIWERHATLGPRVITADLRVGSCTANGPHRKSTCQHRRYLSLLFFFLGPFSHFGWPPSNRLLRRIQFHHLNILSTQEHFG